MVRFAHALTLLGLSLALNASAADWTLDLATRIPLRDGSTLGAVRWLPTDGEGPWPTILLVTPYGASQQHDRGRDLASRGYAVVSVDLRGRGESDGRFEPLTTEVQDVAEILDAVASAPWCDGRIGMMGGSYLGTMQWMAVRAQHPALKTIVPTAAAAPGIDFPQLGSLRYTYAAQWIALTHGHGLHGKVFGDAAFWSDVSLAHATGQLPFEELTAQVGLSTRTLAVWAKRSASPTGWDDLLPSPSDYAAIDMPILTITGAWDDDQPGALHYYRQHMKHGSAAAASRHYLVLGPWDHSGTRTPTDRVEDIDLDLGQAAVIDMNELHAAWFDHVFRGAPVPELLADRVTYYRVGEGAWHHASVLQALGHQRQTWRLAAGPDGPALQRRPPRSRTTMPVDLSEPTVDQLREEAAAGRLFSTTNLHPDTANRENLLRFTSPALTAPVDVDGAVRVSIAVQTDAVDGAIEAALYHLDPQGKPAFLTRSLLRLAEGRKDHVGEDGARTLVFDRFNTVSQRIPAGHKLHLTLGRLTSLHWERLDPRGPGAAADQPWPSLRLLLDGESVLSLPTTPR